jgi:acetyl esterase/lipase
MTGAISLSLIWQEAIWVIKGKRSKHSSQVETQSSCVCILTECGVGRGLIYRVSCYIEPSPLHQSNTCPYMDKIKDIPTTLPEGIEPTFKALLPHLAANAQNFRKQYAKMESYPYGSDPRQQLDIYYPHATTDESPVLLWLYGGGFFMGDRRHRDSPELIFANLGAFFANKGFVTVVMDYRLSKGPGNPSGSARYPSGGEDIVFALNWIEKNVGQKPVFLMGNSAGAVHVMTFLYEPSLRNSAHAAVAGAVLVAPPAHQRSADSARTPVNMAYYGTEEAIDANSPLQLLVRNGLSDVPILGMVGSLDEPGIIKSWADFKEELRRQGGNFDEIVLEGHVLIPTSKLN